MDVQEDTIPSVKSPKKRKLSTGGNENSQPTKRRKLTPAEKIQVSTPKK